MRKPTQRTDCIHAAMFLLTRLSGMEPKEIVAGLIKAGLTQQQIADRAGLLQPYVSKVLRGEVDDVKSRTYRALLRVHAEVCAEADAPAKAA